MTQNQLDRVGYFLSDLQQALPVNSGWYCWTNRPDMGLQIQKGIDGPQITLHPDGTWSADEAITGVSE